MCSVVLITCCVLWSSRVAASVYYVNSPETLYCATFQLCYNSGCYWRIWQEEKRVDGGGQPAWWPMKLFRKIQLEASKDSFRAKQRQTLKVVYFVR